MDFDFVLIPGTANYFAFSGKVDWMIVLIMIFGSLMGGKIGGKLAGKMKPEKLRWIVVAAWLIAAAAFFRERLNSKKSLLLTSG